MHYFISDLPATPQVHWEWNNAFQCIPVPLCVGKGRTPGARLGAQATVAGDTCENPNPKENVYSRKNISSGRWRRPSAAGRGRRRRLRPSLRHGLPQDFRRDPVFVPAYVS